MSSNLDQLTADAMKLPLRERVQLAQRLVSTIDDEVESDAEALWFAEAARRLEEPRGKVQGKTNRARKAGGLPHARLGARTFREVEVLSRQTLSGLKPTATATQRCVVESRRR